MISKLKAVYIVIQEATAERGSKTALKRLRKALTALELDAAEQSAIECRLDYRKGDGELYDSYK